MNCTLGTGPRRQILLCLSASIVHGWRGLADRLTDTDRLYRALVKHGQIDGHGEAEFLVITNVRSPH